MSGKLRSKWIGPFEINFVGYSSLILFGVFCPIDCLHNNLGLTLVDTSCFTCMLGDDLGIFVLISL